MGLIAAAESEPGANGATVRKGKDIVELVKSVAPSLPTLDSVVNAFDSSLLAELPADMRARLAERAGVAKVRTDIALMLGTHGGAQGESDKPLTVDEAARLCGCTPAWIRRQALHNRAWAPFTHRLTRKRVLFDGDMLRAWLASRRP